jgi:two-component system, chemotaxis family, CheB/CheR fusion protein
MTTTDTDSSVLPSSALSEKFIIGIGASAGGMAAIHELFDHTPSDDVSYVIIQHLSPDHKSLMKELLVKHSKLKIFVAENEMEVKPNCVYVLPEGKNMTISGGKLILKDRPSSTPNSAVDIFFNALAEDLGNKSIGIVLSGNGADGTKGIEAIKKVGGMVIVQDPKSTEFNDMPNNAIKSGYYDHILAPKLIPLQIVRYIKQKTLTENLSIPLSEENEAALSDIHLLIKGHTPLDFSDYKRPTIIRRITRRMLAREVETMAEYVEILKNDPSEIELLSQDFLISVTGFFRDSEAFDIIAKKVIPEMVEHKLLVDVLKIWVIGCATGEEAYSLAILVKEHLSEINKELEVKIFASDIDQEVINKASKGCYPESISKDVSEDRLNKFFTKIGGEYKVNDSIRKMIIFAKHDIIHQPPYGKIDLISCRNLMIYFNLTLQKKIFAAINYCLNANGFLFLGPSEGLGTFKAVFNEIDKKWKIYQNTEDNNSPQGNIYSPQHWEVNRHSFSSQTIKPFKNQSSHNLPTLLYQSTLEESAFQAGVGVDENNMVILPFGDFDKYMAPKLFNHNLLEVLPEDLAVVVGTSIKKATKENENVAVENITFKMDQDVRSVNILVKPVVNDNKGGRKILFIYFAEGASTTVNNKSVEVFEKGMHTGRYLKELEQDLAETKKRLQEALNSLDESHNNIQSYDEELLSGNEEMQSSNEELQSINEELNTVNLEYQDKIRELAETNDDLDNYFKSTHITQLHIDKNLNLKKYNPVTINQINIKVSDIGRPLADISTNIRFSNLIEDIKSVLNTRTNKEKEIETTDGKWYLMTIVPYIRSETKEPDGVIITFNNITDITQTRFIIQEANRRLEQIIKDQDTFIYSASNNLLPPLNNMERLLYQIKESDDLLEVKTVSIPLMESVTRLKETISELSKNTRLADKVEENGKVNLLELLKEVKLSMTDSLNISGAKIWVDLKEKDIYFFKPNLRSIFLNLLSNAVKYRSPDRQLSVAIKSKRVDGFMVLSFEDNGIGIKENLLGDVFSKFRTIEDEEINPGGIGVGLYLIKKIIINAGGRIEVQSKYGSGTCFTAYIRQSS